MLEPPLPPLHTQNPLGRFSDRADDYAKYRPSYPPAAIDAILTGLAPRSGSPTALNLADLNLADLNLSDLNIADIGAGTGISSRLLADQGVQVWAIEPNAAMRAAAQVHPGVKFRAGSAEQTGLPDQSMQGVTCCQSFHWFEPTATLTEFARILQPGGRVAILWNDRDRQDEFTEAYTDVIRQSIDQRYLERLDRKASDAEALKNSAQFTHYRALSFPYTHRLNRTGLVGIALSASYVPKQGELHQQLVTRLAQLYDRWSQERNQDFVALSYQTRLFLAESC